MRRVAVFQPVENPYMKMLYEGVERSGDIPVAIPCQKEINLKGFDTALCWSMKKHPFIKSARQAQVPLLVAEAGYLGDRGGNDRALGWEGINGDADFCNQNVPSDRAQRWLPQMKPWKTGGEYILLCGQVLGDASLHRLHQRLAAFYMITAKNLMQAYDLPVVFRPHPLWCPNNLPKWLTVSKDRSLQEDLEGAWLTVAWGSNSLVDATLAGCPTLAFDPIAMTWDISIHSVGQTPILPDRQEWLNRISYAQWTNDEFRDGTAWQHVRQYLERV